MSPPGAQLLLARLLVEPALFADVRADPETFAARYGLPVADVRRLGATGEPGLYTTAAVTRLKKFEAVEVAFPATLRRCRAVWDDETIFDRYLARARLTTLRGVIALGERLGALVREATAPADLDVVADLHRYELLLHEVRLRALERAPTPAVAGPALGPGVTVATFGTPVSKVRRRVLDEAPFDDLRDRETHYVLAPGPDNTVRAHRIPSGLRNLLDNCDGTRTVPALGAALGLSVESVRHALASLRDKGVEVTGAW
ncbi:hypothetical protein GCM10022225_83610 [Plantactinospora mayteni]|uniref:Uncharacterized protein n=1 Tax=Plantactinospora mayteni TaxID=566021 RepID=A0ABQ4F4H3_9ACTN|nr:hypothetical protein [Plantactinospora mayteni]GIH01815.1 hypothetical protein Pma05_83870 [Plantactinospora mayteni]